MNRTALTAAIFYMALAGGLTAWDARSSSPGAWISLRQIVPFLLTFPVSAPLEWLGLLPDLTRWPNVAALIGICGAGVYGLVNLTMGWFTSR